MKRILKNLGMLGLLLGAVVTAQAQDNNLEKKVDALSEEIEKLKAGSDAFAEIKSKEGVRGLGPAASKVYGAESGVTIAGYGEVVYENYASKKEDGTDANKIDRLDALRGVLYVGYKFNDWILLNTEYEWEHTDEASLEFAYLDFMFNDYVNLRAGLLLVPMGLVNQLHEPVVFLGAKRPVTESVILPSTWRENGVGFYGSAAGFDYKLYLINGMDATGFSSSGLRGGRQKGGKAKSDDFAGVARIDYVGFAGLMLGVSGYYGDSGQSQVGAPVNTQIADAHIDWKYKGISLRAVGAVARLNDTEKLNSSLGLTGSKAVAKELAGYFVEVGYDIFRLLGIQQEMTVFGRYEKVNTQNAVDGSFQIDPSNEQQVITAGIHYQPIVNVVLKADYQHITNKAKTGISQWNLAMGYVF